MTGLHNILDLQTLNFTARTIPFLSVSQLMTLATGQWSGSLTSVFNSTISRELHLNLLHFIVLEVKWGIPSSVISKIHSQCVEFFSISYYRDLVFLKIQEVASQLLTSLSTNLKVKWQLHWYHLQCVQWFQWIHHLSWIHEFWVVIPILPLLTWFGAPKLHQSDSQLVDSSSKLSNHYPNSARILQFCKLFLCSNEITPIIRP